MYGYFQQERYVRVAKNITEDSDGVGGEIPFSPSRPYGLERHLVSRTPWPCRRIVADGSFLGVSPPPRATGENSSATSGYKAFIPAAEASVIAETGPVHSKPGYTPPGKPAKLQGGPAAMT